MAYGMGISFCSPYTCKMPSVPSTSFSGKSLYQKFLDSCPYALGVIIIDTINNRSNTAFNS